MEAVVGGLEVDDHGKDYTFTLCCDNCLLYSRESTISISVRHSPSQHLIFYKNSVRVVW